MSASTKSASTMTAREVADMTGYSRFHIAKLARKGAIPGARQMIDGGRWLFDRDQVRAWLRRSEVLRAK